MMLCTLSDIYKSPWGVLQSRREEAENASYGKFDGIFDCAIADAFYNIEQIAEAMDCHPQTATRRLKNHPVRYIKYKERHWYKKEDAGVVITKHATKGR